MNPLAIVIIVLLIVLMIGGGWSYRQGWYSPHYGIGGSIIGFILVALLILLLVRGSP
jgi:hypothetical protein